MSKAEPLPSSAISALLALRPWLLARLDGGLRFALYQRGGGGAGGAVRGCTVRADLHRYCFWIGPVAGKAEIRRNVLSIGALLALCQIDRRPRDAPSPAPTAPTPTTAAAQGEKKLVAQQQMVASPGSPTPDAHGRSGCLAALALALGSCSRRSRELMIHPAPDAQAAEVAGGAGLAPAIGLSSVADAVALMGGLTSCLARGYLQTGPGRGGAEAAGAAQLELFTRLRSLRRRLLRLRSEPTRLAAVAAALHSAGAVVTLLEVMALPAAVRAGEGGGGEGGGGGGEGGGGEPRSDCGVEHPTACDPASEKPNAESMAEPLAPAPAPAPAPASGQAEAEAEAEAEERAEEELVDEEEDEGGGGWSGRGIGSALYDEENDRVTDGESSSDETDPEEEPPSDEEAHEAKESTGREAAALEPGLATRLHAPVPSAREWQQLESALASSRLGDATELDTIVDSGSDDEAGFFYGSSRKRVARLESIPDGRGGGSRLGPTFSFGADAYALGRGDAIATRRGGLRILVAGLAAIELLACSLLRLILDEVPAALTQLRARASSLLRWRSVQPLLLRAVVSWRRIGGVLEAFTLGGAMDSVYDRLAVARAAPDREAHAALSCAALRLVAACTVATELRARLPCPVEPLLCELLHVERLWPMQPRELTGRAGLEGVSRGGADPGCAGGRDAAFRALRRIADAGAAPRTEGGSRFLRRIGAQLSAATPRAARARPEAAAASELAALLRLAASYVCRVGSYHSAAQLTALLSPCLPAIRSSLVGSAGAAPAHPLWGCASRLEEPADVSRLSLGCALLRLTTSLLSASTRLASASQATECRVAWGGPWLAPAALEWASGLASLLNARSSLQDELTPLLGGGRGVARRAVRGWRGDVAAHLAMCARLLSSASQIRIPAPLTPRSAALAAAPAPAAPAAHASADAATAAPPAAPPLSPRIASVLPAELVTTALLRVCAGEDEPSVGAAAELCLTALVTSMLADEPCPHSSSDAPSRGAELPTEIPAQTLCDLVRACFLPAAEPPCNHHLPNMAGARLLPPRRGTTM